MPYPTHLYWLTGRGGFARLRGVHCALSKAPRLNGIDVHFIQYLPMASSTIARVQDRSVDPPRDLLPDEIEKVLFFLAKLCGE